MNLPNFFQRLQSDLPITLRGILRLCVYPQPALEYATKHMEIVLKAYNPFECFENYCITYATKEELYIDYDQYDRWCIELDVDPEMPFMEQRVVTPPLPVIVKPEAKSTTKEELAQTIGLDPNKVPPLNSPEYFAHLLVFNKK